MAQSRMHDFRKRQLKETQANAQKTAVDVQNLFKMLLGMAGRIYKLEQRVNSLFPTAKIADWRSLAIMKVLSEHAVLQIADADGTMHSFETHVTREAEKLQIENFAIESAEDDKAKGLEIADDLTAAKDLYAIANIRVYKGDRELEDQQIVRTKIHLGSNEMFPELDDALIGMKVGEKKRFKLELQGETDSAEVSLLGLRKLKAKDEAKPQP